MVTTIKSNWQQAAALKQQQRLASIPQEWILPESFVARYDLSSTSTTNVISLDLVRTSGILSDLELEITEKYNADELVEKMTTGLFTSEQVTVAYCKRSAIAQQLTNCLTEIFYDRALERARSVDEYFKVHKKPIGPLHGLPISIKDSFNYSGIPSTIGFIDYLKNEAPQENSVLTDMLLDLGAVLYVKTNIPQTLMTCDSDNNVFGRTLNPHNLSLTAGGSSGGESALVALRGSPIGIGTDLGGSIRMPAACTGVYGFKPSSCRIPYSKQTGGAATGLHSVYACAGPLCNIFDELAFFMKSIIDARPWDKDPMALAVPWRTLPAADETLTIGVLAEEPRFPLHPPVRRALSTAADKLAKAGHKIVHLSHDPKYNLSLSNDLMFEYYGFDPDQTALNIIKKGGEPIVPSLLKMNTLGQIDEAKRGDGRALAAMNRLRVEMINYWRDVFVQNKLDVIIAPPSQCTAVEHDCWNWIPYTTSFNLVDFPAIIVPFSSVQKDLDSEPFTLKSGQVGPKYNPDHLDGAPCAVQIIARNLQDEECLRAGKIIDDILRS